MAGAIIGLGARLFVEDMMSGALRTNTGLMEQLTDAMSGAQARAAFLAQTIGRDLQRAGEALSQPLIESARSAGNFESEMLALERVSKNLSDKELAELKARFLDIGGGVVPATALELAGAAEEIAKVGDYSVDAIEQMSMVATQLSTLEKELSPEKAAQAISQLGNVLRLEMGTAENNASRLGSTIVALSNATAATGEDIIKGSLAIGGFAEKIGFSAGETLALSAALRQVGETSKQGATRLQALITAMASDTDEFGKLLGITTAEFEALVRQDPAAAFIQIGDAMAKIDPIGGKFKDLLNKLGISSQRQLATTANLLKLLGENQGLAGLMKLGNEAFAENLELQEQYAKRSRGLNSALEKLNGAWETLKIRVGDVLLPVLTLAVNALTLVLRLVAMIPAPILAAGVVFMGLAAALLFVTGTLIVLGAKFFLFFTFWKVVLGFVIGGATVLTHLGAAFVLVASTIAAVLPELLALTAVFLFFRPMLGGVYDLVVSTVTLVLKFGELLVRVILFPLQLIARVVSTLGERLLGVHFEWLDDAGKGLTSMSKVLDLLSLGLQIFIDMWDLATGAVLSFVDWALSDITLFVTLAKALLFSSPLLGIETGIDGIVSAITTRLKPALEVLQAVFETLKGVVTWVFGKASGAIGAVADAAKGLVVGSGVPAEAPSVKPKGEALADATVDQVVKAAIVKAEFMVGIRVQIGERVVQEEMRRVRAEDAARDFQILGFGTRGVS